jgi:hypothetical protein
MRTFEIFSQKFEDFQMKLSSFSIFKPDNILLQLSIIIYFISLIRDVASKLLNTLIVVLIKIFTSKKLKKYNFAGKAQKNL